MTSLQLLIAPRRAPGPLLATLLLLASCGSDGADPGRWVRLAEGHRPSFLPDGPLAWRPAPGENGGPLSLQPAEGAAVWAVRTLAPEDWTRHAETGAWVTPRRFVGTGPPPDGAPGQRLVVGGDDWRALALNEAVDAAARGERDVFCAAGDRLFALGATPDQPPAAAQSWEYVSLGHAAGTTWRQRIGPVTTDALPVLPGFAEERVVDVPPASVLRFTTVARAFAPAGAEGPRLRFRVSLDGVTLFDEELGANPGTAVAAHTVALPAGGVRRARLRFRVDGPAALAAFGAPTLGPAEVGAYGARPWSARPDLVLFLADTFRADNLAAYGGDPALTPHLDAFAADAVRFDRAWSSSTWTLPTHAALFSGLYPPQSAVVAREVALSPDAVTIAEHLAAAGYRTGAVTDQGFVSETYGLDQGFEWFREEWTGLDDTLAAAAAFLERDDGRPVFLFVHTYRTHTPYVVSVETRARLGAHLGLTTDFDALLPELEALGDELHRPDPSPAARAHMAQLAALYRGAAADLDAGFQRFRDDLDARGLRDAWLLFTSDHGEGLFEHGATGHGDLLYEEFLRVPLLIRGPGREPRVVRQSATSVDLPPTLARLAGLAPVRGWVGHDLLSLTGDRPALSFRCKEQDEPRLALIDGAQKLIAPARAEAGRDGAVRQAYDLATDPHERTDARAAAWPTTVLRHHADLLSSACTQVFAAEAAALSPEARAELEALGYVGD